MPVEEALPDAAARHRVTSQLERNLLVEAGAGAGKTTAMVDRMVALVRTGTARMEGVAAVTFTRKAAGELRERFQTALEAAVRQARAAGQVEEAERLDHALRDIQRGFVGTIHAFCARLLRERPLDAGLDPGFREVTGAEEVRLRQRFWQAHLERLAAAGDERLGALARVGLRAPQLMDLFTLVAGNPDVRFEAEALDRPDPDPVRRRLEALMDEAAGILPIEEPPDGWDPLQERLRTLRFHRFVLGWRDERFFDALATLFDRKLSVVQQRWGPGAGTRRAAQALLEDFQAFTAPGSAAERLVAGWRAYRYPAALAFVQDAATAYEEERRRRGTLNFQDLLQRTARLLRSSPAARRELGERYRHLLVDEFQDTDPVQAEVLWLLASPPDSATEGDPPRWWHARPRPGALFVVGDPKQSIYRFRRADVALYQQIRARFAHDGAVLELTANFRSLPVVTDFVNAVFSARFPEQATAHQAAYSPLMPLRPAGAGAVRHYGVEEAGSRDENVAAEAARLAAWMRARVDRGERTAGDFLILTPTRKRLAAYARAVEAAGLPVQVTGAGVGLEYELDELLLLLRALHDPGDARLTVAVLVGLFFGLDYELLTAFTVDRAGRLDLVRPPPEGAGGPVEDALRRLHGWWRRSRNEPADVFLPALVDELGLLPHAAAGELGASRAGALLFLLDSVRAAAIVDDASLGGAIAAVEGALESDEAEAPLEPGRGDVVRVMNLHKAKGLEAAVVVLAHPYPGRPPEPVLHVERAVQGTAVGWAAARVEERGAWRLLAHPLDWAERVDQAELFERAERERLLYVAATRARDELVLAVPARQAEKSPWAPLYDALEMPGSYLELPAPGADVRAPLELDAGGLAGRLRAASDTRAALATPSYHAASVTARVKDGHAAHPGSPAGKGPAWGTVVHGLLEAAARGARGESLRETARGLLLANERELDAGGAPVELDELLALVEAVRAAPLWQRAEAA
ncbi:MAG: UvrD-helicase domain-containing protein, partial [Gemmatimonadota bacterium]